MAHNLIQHEDDGRENFKRLASRSFLEQDCSKSCKKHTWRSETYVTYRPECDGKMYLMHDLIHDVLQMVSKHDCHLIHDGNIEEQIPASVQHVSAMFSESDERRDKRVYDHMTKHKKLRTLMLRNVNVSILEHLSTHMPCLRVLVLNDISRNLNDPEIRILLKSICNLKHLRLLDLSGVKFRELPILDLRGGSPPSTITRLVNLRHFFWKAAVQGIGKLALLQTCPPIMGFHIRELKDLNELRGTLEIRKIGLVPKFVAQQACLGSKRHLKILRLYWSWRQLPLTMAAQDMTVAEEVLEALKPCQGLEKIEITGYVGAKPPSWLNDSWMRSLTSIRLYSCRALETLPHSLGTMPQLKTLELGEMLSLKEMRWQYWKQQPLPSSSVSPVVVLLFPALESLVLSILPKCTGWCVEEGLKQEDTKSTATREPAAAAATVVSVLPRLKKLTLAECPNLQRFQVRAPTLTYLSMDEIRTEVVPELLASLGCFTSLRKLSISSCPTINSLREINISFMRKNSFRLIADVAKFQLTLRADVVEILAFLGSCNSLRKLTILGCPSIKSCDLSAKGMTGLEELSLENCHQIASVWLPSPTFSIDELSIANCPNLTYIGVPLPTTTASYSSSSSFALPMPSSSPDQEPGCCPGHLSMRRCNHKQLKSLLHVISLANLEELIIHKCSDIEHVDDFPQLDSLKTLLIIDCPKLTSLSPKISCSEGLLSLEKIYLSRCPLLSVLPDLSPLTSLRKLELIQCLEVKDLPGLSHLTSLQRLLIIDCEQLQHKYKQRMDD